MSIARTALLVAGGVVAIGACAALCVMAFRRLVEKDDVAYRAETSRRIAQAISEKTGLGADELLPTVTQILAADGTKAALPDAVLRIELHFNRTGDDVTEELYLALAGDGNAVVNQRARKLTWEETPPFIRKRFFVEGTKEIRLLIYQKAGVEA